MITRNKENLQTNCRVQNKITLNIKMKKKMISKTIKIKHLQYEFLQNPQVKVCNSEG